MASNGNWITRRLGDLCEKIGSGATPRGGASVYRDQGAAFIRSQNIYNDKFDPNGLVFLDDSQAEELRGVEVKPNDVLLNITGDSVARCNRAPATLIPARVSQHVAIIRPRPEHLRPRFLHYLFISPLWQELLLSLSSAGGTRQALTKGMIEGLKVPVPDIAEQTAIESVLTPLDDKIELNRRTNETLEAMARSLFKSWFLDFDPVTAKAGGKKPFGMTVDLAALFPREFVDSDLGPIPKGWRISSIGKEVDFLVGFAFKSSGFLTSPPGIRLVRGDNVKERSFHWNDKTRYWPKITPELERYALAPGDSLIGMDGSKVGKNFARIRAFDLPCLLVQRVARLRANGAVGKCFIWLTVSSGDFTDYVNEVRTGTSIPHISGGQIKEYRIVRPPTEKEHILVAFERAAGEWLERVDRNECESESLSKLRDLLLPKLLSGEIRLRDAERKIKEVV